MIMNLDDLARISDKGLVRSVSVWHASPTERLCHINFSTIILPLPFKYIKNISCQLLA